MKTKFLLPLLLAVFIFSCNSHEEKKSSEMSHESEALDSIQLINRGKYLVDLGGCNHCHSPKIMTERGPVPDPDRLLSGYPAENPLPPYDEETSKAFLLFTMDLTSGTGPWGTSFAANLTPDVTGIGTWSEKQFFTALRQGKFMGLEGSRQILPPMPWEDIGKLSDEDLRAIFSYLKSIKPVENVVPAPIPPKME